MRIRNGIFFRVLSVISLGVLLIGFVSKNNSEAEWFKAVWQSVSKFSFGGLIAYYQLATHPMRYVIVLDSGSTGSRLHVFKIHEGVGFRFSEVPSPDSVEEILYHSDKSLSAELSRNLINGSDSSAIESSIAIINPLLERACKVIPRFLHPKTPIVFRATAGMRTLDKSYPGISEAVIRSIEHTLNTKWPFQASFQGGINKTVSILPGKEEGIYAWMALNWLLNRFNSNERLPTASIIDLGGTSAQLVFEIPVNKKLVSINQNVVDIVINRRSYRLSYRTNEYYGLVYARKRLSSATRAKLPVCTNSGIEDCHNEVSDDFMSTNCYVGGRKFTLKDHTTGEVYQVLGKSKGHNECKAHIYNNMFNASDCSHRVHYVQSVVPVNYNPTESIYPEGVQNCFHGITHPEELAFFRSGEIYAMSFIFDNFSKVHLSPVDIGIKTKKLPNYVDKDSFIYEFDLELLSNIARYMCETSEYLDREHMSNYFYEKMSHQCIDLTYIQSLLKHGYRLNDHKVIRSVKKINNLEASWPLGIMLNILANCEW